MAMSPRSGRRRGSGLLLALLSAAAITLAPTGSAPPAGAATALVMGGTDQPKPGELGDYMPRVRQYFLDPNTSCTVAVCHLEPVDYPAEFWPFPQWGGLEALTYDRSVADGVVNLDAALQTQLTSRPGDELAIFGSSQSATVVTIVKRRLAGATPEVKSHLEIVVIGNPNRPNGGLLSRFYPLSIPVLEFTANGATPTDTGIATTDIAFQYDIAADFPRYPLNPFALLNILVGIDIHGSYTVTRNGYTELELRQAIDDPANRQTFGDTTYITIPTRDLPLVQPIRQFGSSRGISEITEPLVALIEPTLRVLVELGYDRTIDYGRPTPAGLFPRIDPHTLVSDLASAAQAGLADARAEIAAAQRQSLDPAAPAHPTSAPPSDDSVTPRRGLPSHRHTELTTQDRGAQRDHDSHDDDDKHDAGDDKHDAGDDIAPDETNTRDDAAITEPDTTDTENDNDDDRTAEPDTPASEAAVG